jgi:hypothetical protein
MMVRIVQNKLRPARDCNGKLCNLGLKEANTIGAGLASSIAANLTAHNAVDEWILRYPAMKELEDSYAWFRPMMDMIAQRLLESVSWGLKLRLFMGAGLSMADLATDIFMVYTCVRASEESAEKKEPGRAICGRSWLRRAKRAQRRVQTMNHLRLKRVTSERIERKKSPEKELFAAEAGYSERSERKEEPRK